MPPHVRCPKGKRLTFDGSKVSQQVDITLSGLILNETFVYFQDSSVDIDSCKFKGSKRGVRFLISTKMVSNIQITNSTFVGNKKCILVESAKNLSHKRSQVIFNLKNSSFHDNTISDKGGCLSFSESPDNTLSVSCNITLENVTFSYNKFNSRGLVFLELENGTQSINLKEVTFENNSPLSDKDVLTGDHSEWIVRSNFVNIIISESNFTSQKARLFNVSASTTLLQIYKSHFRDHKVEGKGGVISIRRAELCKLNVSTSSFVNTTAGRGGAFNVECAKVRLSLHENKFTENIAMNGTGGAVSIDALDNALNSSECATNNKFGPSNESEEHLQIEVTKCRFAHSGGDAVFINASKNVLFLIMDNSSFLRCKSGHGHGTISVHYKNEIQINISNSHFISNHGNHGGVGGLLVDDETTSDQQCTVTASHIIIENSRFLNNTARYGGAMFLRAYKKKLIVHLHEVTMENNTGWVSGGVAFLDYIFALKIRQSRFSRNTAGVSGGALYTNFVNRLEVQDSLFEDNYVMNKLSQGGALFFLGTTVLKGQGCDVSSHKDDGENSSSLICEDDLRFENVTFERNTGEVGGALYLITRDVTLRNCHFVDNLASSQGGHIYTYYGNTNLTIQGCLFLQTIKELRLGTMNYSKASFIHAERSGTLIISNTTMDVRAYATANPLMLITNGKVIDLGNDDNLTKFFCPVGSRMGIINFTSSSTTAGDLTKTMVTTLELSCSPCTENSYSMQRGRALGSNVDFGFQCLTCPFGANCTKNILAKRNFWGFPEHDNPPTLRFSMCPVGYCIPSQETNFPEYNGCQGNRSGELCGNCTEGYTETLYSTHCRPSHQCNDYWFWPVALVYVSLMALYFTFEPPIVPWIKRQILWFKENKPEDRDNNFDKGYMKILFYFYQAANLLLISRYLQYPNNDSITKPLVGLLNFNLLSSRLSCPFPGLTVVTKQLFCASNVFGILLVISAFYLLHCGIQKIRGQEAPSAGPYIGGILQTVLLGYTTLATVSLSLLRCVPIGLERRLFYDGNIVCFQWWQYIVIVFACIFVIPFVFVLFWGSFKLYGRTLSVGKFLLACFAPLPSLIYWLFVWFSRVIGYSVSSHSSSCQVSRDSVERVLYESFKRPEDGSKLSLSWESIMIGRRLILVMMDTFVSDPLPRLLVMNLFCVLFLLHHVLAQPFRDSIANTIETISLLSIVVLATGNVFFASFLSLAVPLNENHFSSSLKFFRSLEIAILCFVPFIFGLFIVTAMLSQLCRLAVVICRVMWNFCSRCSRSSYSNEGDETKPLLIPVT